MIEGIEVTTVSPSVTLYLITLPFKIMQTTRYFDEFAPWLHQQNLIWGWDWGTWTDGPNQNTLWFRDAQIATFCYLKWGE